MKKTVTAFLSFLTLLCVSAFCGTVFTACNFDIPKPEYTHTYATEWSFDDTYHWHNCESKNCLDVSEKAQHTFENNLCTVCGYKGTIASVSEVTEETFRAALSFDSVASMTVLFVGSGYGQSSTIYFDGNKTEVYSNGMTMYVEDCGTFAYCYYSDSEHDKWYRVKIEKNDEEYSTLTTFNNWKTEFSNYDFSDFDYIGGYYVGNHVFEKGTDNEYVGDVEIRFEDGRLVRFCVEYKMENVSDSYSLSFSAYNETTVTLPTNYDDVNPASPPPETSSDWASYLDLPNVTITETMTYVKNGMTENSTLKNVWKTDNAAWICYQDYLSVDGDVLTTNIVYFDGTNGYLNGTATESVDWYHYRYEGLFVDLENLESFFEKSIQSSTTVLYSADTITLYGVTAYTNVRITIENGHITTIVYTKANAVMDGSTGETYSGTYTFVFTNYGTTKIDYTVQNDSAQEEHSCSFVLETVKDECLKSAATCINKAVYYKSCSCGKKGTDTFECGALGEHNYVEEICSKCSKKINDSDGLKFELSADETYYILSGIGSCTDDMVTVPATYCNLPIKEIKERALYNCKTLTSIKIPNSIVSIGDSAFRGCDNLTSLTLPFIGASVTANNTYDQVLGYIFGFATGVGTINGTTIQCFCNSTYYHYYIPTSLTEVIIIDGNNIPKGAFKGCCFIKNIIFPSSIKEIGCEAFSGCSSLKSIEIPSAVTKIEQYAFADCDSLEKVNYWGTVDEWAEIDFAFQTYELNYYSEQTYTSLSNPTYYAKDLYIQGDLLTDIKLTNVFSISPFAFYDCKSIESVELPESVRSISHSAFYGCELLKSITLSNKVSYLGVAAFYGCSAMTRVTIPKSVTKISSFAFKKCNSLKEVYYLGTVEDWAQIEFDYYDYWRLKNNFTGSNPAYVGKLYIQGELLTNAELKTSSSVSHYAFYGCKSLESIAIPKTVTYIGSYAFCNCKSLTSITFKGTKAEWEAIKKSYNWDFGSSITIVKCDDGNVSISPSNTL